MGVEGGCGEVANEEECLKGKLGPAFFFPSLAKGSQDGGQGEIGDGSMVGGCDSMP